MTDQNGNVREQMLLGHASDHEGRCRSAIPKGRHSEGPPFSAISSSDNLRLGIWFWVRVRVRVNIKFVAISRTIPCNDHEWWLSEWRILRNGGPELNPKSAGRNDKPVAGQAVQRVSEWPSQPDYVHLTSGRCGLQRRYVGYQVATSGRRLPAAESLRNSRAVQLNRGMRGSGGTELSIRLQGCELAL